jgi:hypothetical protein
LGRPNPIRTVRAAGFVLDVDVDVDDAAGA